MVVHIYSVSEWNVVLSQEIQSYWLSLLLLSQSSSSFSTSSSSCSTNNNNNNGDSSCITDHNEQQQQQQQQQQEQFLQRWLCHSIKVAPTTTICRYNYCHDRFVVPTTTSNCILTTDCSNNTNTTLVQQEQEQEQQQEQQQQHMKDVEEQIQQELQKSIYDWIKQRNCNKLCHDELISNMEDKEDGTIKIITTTSINDEEEDVATTAVAAAPIVTTVMVQPHAILHDVLSIQITTTTTATADVPTTTTNAMNTQQQQSNSYNLFYNNTPPPLYTWYKKLNANAHNNNNDNTVFHNNNKKKKNDNANNDTTTTIHNNNNDDNNDDDDVKVQQEYIENSITLSTNETSIQQQKQSSSSSSYRNNRHYLWRKQQHWPSYPYGVMIIDRICGEAILRGANIYCTNGILCTDTYITINTPVAVYIDMTQDQQQHSSTATTTTNMDSSSSSKKNINIISNSKFKKISRGITLEEYSTGICGDRKVIFIGYGIAKCSRSEMFTSSSLSKSSLSSRQQQQGQHESPQKTIISKLPAVEMIHIATPISSNILPSTNDILSNNNNNNSNNNSSSKTTIKNALVVQNLPSILVAHELLYDWTNNNNNDNNIRIEWILDMCCAPGGKTSHLASIVSRTMMQQQRHQNNNNNNNNQGFISPRIIACDKSITKVVQVRNTLQALQCCSSNSDSKNDMVIPIALDTTKCVLQNMSSNNEISLSKIVESADIDPNHGLLQIHGFPPESFDRILLDPPCSALGLRPKLCIVQTKVEHLQSICSYQKQFITSAIQLLKPGGIMTYSTCTIHVGENECMVRYILDTYPNMELLPIYETKLGGPGWFGYGLNRTKCQYVRRFDPTDITIDDTIGFFIAKFRKKEKL